MTQNSRPQVRQICPTVTKEMTAKGAFLVDVRERPEIDQLAFDEPNIIAIPLGELQTRYHELPRDCELVMACKGGGRSLQATHFLMSIGFDKVVNMEGGIINWVNKGLPVKQGAK